METLSQAKKPMNKKYLETAKRRFEKLKPVINYSKKNGFPVEAGDVKLGHRFTLNFGNNSSLYEVIGITFNREKDQHSVTVAKVLKTRVSSNVKNHYGLSLKELQERGSPFIRYNQTVDDLWEGRGIS
jgi:hypothetical protein